MRKKIVGALAVAAVSALMLGAPAGAHGTGPCEDSGEPGNSDYAKHHISFLAKQGELGNDGHKPGSHRGYSACDPSS